MTSLGVQAVICPKCGAKLEVNVYRSINVAESPEARDSVLACNLNTWECPQCGEEGMVDRDLLYNDPALGFCVWYFPPERLRDDTFVALFDASYPPTVQKIHHNLESTDIPALARSLYLTQPHLVFTLMDLVYCIVFYERLLGGNRN